MAGCRGLLRGRHEGLTAEQGQRWLQGTITFIGLGPAHPDRPPGRPGFIGVPFSAMVLMFSPLSTVPFFPPLVKQRRSALPAILVSFDFSMAPRKSSVLFSPRPVRKGFTRLLRPEFLPQPFAFTVNG